MAMPKWKEKSLGGLNSYNLRMLNYRLPRKGDRGRDALSQERGQQLVFWSQVISPENTHTIMLYEWSRLYLCTYMHAIYN